jgi:glutathione S-transferase
MKLYSGPLSMFGAKAEIAAHEKGLDVELVMVPFEMKTLYQPKHPEVLRINPKGQVPVLIDGDLELFDSTQIFEYFETVKPEPALWPPEPRARARARLLEHKSDEVYFPPIVRLMGLQATPDDPAAVEARAAPLPSTTRSKRISPARSGWPEPTPTPTSLSTWRSFSVSAWARP